MANHTNHRRLPAEKIDAIIEGRRAGRPIRQIAREQGVSTGAVYYWCREVEGLPAAAKGAPRGQRPVTTRRLLARLTAQLEALCETVGALDGRDVGDPEVEADLASLRAALGLHR